MHYSVGLINFLPLQRAERTLLQSPGTSPQTSISPQTARTLRTANQDA